MVRGRLFDAALSSSTMIPVAGAPVAASVETSTRKKVSSGSAAVSAVMGTATVFSVSPGANSRAPVAGAKSASAVAVPLAVV